MKLTIYDFVDRDFATTWFTRDGVPLALLKDAGGALPELSWKDFAEPIPDNVFQEMLKASLERAHNPDTPAHGHAHASRNVTYLLDALLALQRILDVTLPERFVQVILLAMARHDWEHPGATFFALLGHEKRGKLAIPEGLTREIDEYAVEYRTSIYADEASRNDGLTVADRMLQLYVIWSTTNPTKPERMAYLGIDPVEPEKIIGRLSQAVDVTPTTDDTTNTRFEAGLFCQEMVPENPPRDTRAYAESRARFTGIIRARYELVDKAVYDLLSIQGGRLQSLVEEVHWKHALDRVTRFLDKLQDKSAIEGTVTRAVLASAFATAGHTLAA